MSAETKAALTEAIAAHLADMDKTGGTLSGWSLTMESRLVDGEKVDILYMHDQLDPE